MVNAVLAWMIWPSACRRAPHMRHGPGQVDELCPAGAGSSPHIQQPEKPRPAAAPAKATSEATAGHPEEPHGRTPQQAEPATATGGAASGNDPASSSARAAAAAGRSLPTGLLSNSAVSTGARAAQQPTVRPTSREATSFSSTVPTPESAIAAERRSRRAVLCLSRAAITDGRSPAVHREAGSSRDRTCRKSEPRWRSRTAALMKEKTKAPMCPSQCGCLSTSRGCASVASV